MNDLPNKISQSPPAKLAQIMAWMEQTPVSWHPSDLAALLQHQLAAPIAHDLGTLPGTEAALQKPIAEIATSGRPLTFRELVRDPGASIHVFRMMGHYFGAHRSHPDSLIPKEISDVLYFSCIAIALSRFGERITHLDDDSLRKHLETTASLDWLDEELRPVFQAALRWLGPPP